MEHEHGLRAALERIEREYSPTEDRPLGRFVGLLGAAKRRRSAPSPFGLSRRLTGES